MNRIIIFLLIVSPSLLFGQDIRKITDVEENETFYVLKSQKTVKQGEYKKYNHKNELLIKGFYKQGVRDSIWECYDVDGQLTVKYNFTNNNLIFYKPEKEDNKYKIVSGNNRIDTTLNRPPIYLGGNALIISVLFRNMRYPSEARERGITGRVKVCLL